MKILITSGPTREPIDSVRFISNLSSGQTGRVLANYFHDQGNEVVSLFGQGSARPEKVGRTLEFNSFAHLDSILQGILKEEEFDFVIHLAAVSDYSIADVFRGKIESEAEELKLNLKKNFKIIDRLKAYATTGKKVPKVIGFKLTSSEKDMVWQKAIDQLYSRGQVDLVVHNDLSDYSEKSEDHRFRIVDKKMNIVECLSIFDLCQKLERFLGEMK